MTKRCWAKILIPTSNDGMALMMIFWLITILMCMVVAFCLMTKANVHSALAASEAIRGKSLARAGLERAIVELFYRAANREKAVAGMETDAWKPDGRPYTDKVGDEPYIVRIVDESGKIQINALSDSTGVVLTGLLVNLGVSSENAATIVDSILDWKDRDELHRLHGAESTYYMSLPVPYKSKNGPFDALEELLLIKGMTREILFGTDSYPGLINFLTIFSRDDKISINAAAREVLLSIPGLTAEDVDAVMAYREAREIRNAKEEENLLGKSYAVASRYLSTRESNLFSIESAALGRDGKTRFHTIRAVIAMEGTASWRYLYYQSPA